MIIFTTFRGTNNSVPLGINGIQFPKQLEIAAAPSGGGLRGAPWSSNNAFIFNGAHTLQMGPTGYAFVSGLSGGSIPIDPIVEKGGFVGVDVGVGRGT